MSKTKTVGNFELTEGKATISWEGKSKTEPFVRIHDNLQTVLPQDCYIVGKSFADIKSESEDDIIETITLEMPEAFEEDGV